MRSLGFSAKILHKVREALHHLLHRDCGLETRVPVTREGTFRTLHSSFLFIYKRRLSSTASPRLTREFSRRETTFSTQSYRGAVRRRRLSRR